MKALYEIVFPDRRAPAMEGQSGETAAPGYGLYDRALGAAYLNGLWEAIDKNTE